MASIKFSRSLLLLVAVIKCSMTSATDIDIDVCRNNIEKFRDAAAVTIPRNNYQLKLVVGTTLDFQCQSNCGSLKWLYNNTEIKKDYNNPFVEIVNQRRYLANDSCTNNCPSLIQCNDENKILEGPIVYNLTVAFHKVGVYMFQCKSEMQGEVDSLWNFKKVFEVYSKAIMIEVVKEEPTISSPSPSPTSSQFHSLSPSKSSSLSPSQSVLMSPSQSLLPTLSQSPSKYSSLSRSLSPLMSPSQSLLPSPSQSTSQSLTHSNKLSSSRISTSSHFSDSFKSPSSTFIYSSLSTNDITSLNTVTVTSTLLITPVLTHYVARASSTITVSPFKSPQVKATLYILVVLLTVIILFAILGWGLCLLQWRIKKRYQSIKLIEHPGRIHNDKGTISAEIINNGVIANTYEIDCNCLENRQEMASSL